MNPETWFAIVALIFVVLILIASCVKIVPQAQAYVVERLGGYQATWSVGIHLKMPLIDRIAKRVMLKEQVVDFNIFNDTIYYVQEGKTGYDIYSCDESGGNQTLLASVPVAFEESDYGCSTNMHVGDGFIVCEVYAKYLEGTYRYFVDIETGEVKEIEFP